MPSTSPTIQGVPTMPVILRKSALVTLALAAIGSWWLRDRGISGIQDYYFFNQDLPLLLLGGAAMFIAAPMSSTEASEATPLHPRTVIALTVAASALAYIGTWIVMDRYAMSRDEDMADFAARYMQHGLLGLPIPTKLHDLGKASLPLSAGRFITQGFWVSDYLPMNSALRAVAGMVGDRWLAGPILLLAGIAATWKAARLLWPNEQMAASVAVVLAVTSTQLIVNAMTPYATTAHFALNAIWIICFLHGGRSGHAAAILCGLIAAGLHQFHFHLLFLSGFIGWMLLTNRKGLALLYVAAAVGYYLFWDVFWPQIILSPMFGEAPDTSVPQSLFSAILARISKLKLLEPVTSMARFLAWQNLLLLPLIWLGVRAAGERTNGALPITFAFALSLGIGLVLMPWQGFGYGYRYLHHLMPCILLLAAGGVVRLNASNVLLKRQILIGSALFAVCVTAPFAMWRSHQLLMPYATAYRLAAAAPADVVVVDTLAGAYIQDIVRIDDPDARPILLDLSELSIEKIDQLCTTQRVMVFGKVAARAAGVQGDEGSDTPVVTSIRGKRAHMLERGCAHPVPL